MLKNNIKDKSFLPNVLIIMSSDFTLCFQFMSVSAYIMGFIWVQETTHEIKWTDHTFLNINIILLLMLWVHVLYREICCNNVSSALITLFYLLSVLN